MNLKALLFLVPCYLLVNTNLVRAQVIEDNTLSTEVTTENNRDFTVNAGEQRGNNLFHSFREFSVPSNGSVFFDNAVTIQTAKFSIAIRLLFRTSSVVNLCKKSVRASLILACIRATLSLALYRLLEPLVFRLSSFCAILSF